MAVHPGSPLLSTPMILNSVSLWKHWKTLKNIDAQSPPPNSEIIGLRCGLDIRIFKELSPARSGSLLHFWSDLQLLFTLSLCPSHTGLFVVPWSTRLPQFITSSSHLQHGSAFCFSISIAGKPWVSSGHFIPTLTATWAPASTSCYPIVGGLSIPAEVAVTHLHVWSPIA